MLLPFRNDFESIGLSFFNEASQIENEMQKCALFFFFLGLLTLLARPTSIPKALGAATPTHRMPFEAPVVVASGKALNLLLRPILPPGGTK